MDISIYGVASLLIMEFINFIKVQLHTSFELIIKLLQLYLQQLSYSITMVCQYIIEKLNLPGMLLSSATGIVVCGNVLDK